MDDKLQMLIDAIMTDLADIRGRQEDLDEQFRMLREEQTEFENKVTTMLRRMRQRVESLEARHGQAPEADSDG
jgi:peptidoglycan hydrolase CwlO-like protein